MITFGLRRLSCQPGRLSSARRRVRVGLSQRNFGRHGQNSLRRRTGKTATTDEEVSLVKWVIDNQSAVHDAMLERLFEEYPDIRERYLEWLGEEEAKEALPVVRRA